MENSKNILITGASGLIGSRLIEILSPAHRISELSRTPRNPRSYAWDVNKMVLDQRAIDNIDTIVHLAGAGVSDKRWTDERKKEILDSRIQGTRLLFEQLQKHPHTVKTFVAASAIGYYGFEDEQAWFSEDSPPGNDFLANVTLAWEKEVDKISTLGIRVVKIRIGIVLSDKGGALKEMANPVKYLAGAPLGSGTQPVSWIHIDDLCGIFKKAIEDDRMDGAYNGVAPQPVTNKELTVAIAKTLHKPMILPAVPPFVLKIIVGEMAEIVLKGSKVSAKKIMSAGYQFQFANVRAAVADLLR